ncbi:MAG TPA: MarR family winged helix-turn-helix transcriptional regulator [Desulfobacterales bacterium]|jgi:DNA-binding MarR family transcriptional regulator
MTNENERLIKEIVGGVRRLVRAVYLDASKISRRFGLTAAQNAVVRCIVSEGPISSAELSRKLFVTPSNITGIIDRLEKKGLVVRVRQESDRRVVLISLTNAGRKLGKALPDPVESRFISQLADLEPERVQYLAEAMGQILHLFDTQGIEDAPLEWNPEDKESAI